MEFKDKFKLRRKQLKLTQQQVADGVNVSRSVVAKWETGLVTPKDDMMITLAAFLNVDITDLVTDNIEQTLIKKNEEKNSISTWIILGIILIIGILDLLNLIATNLILGIILYTLIGCAFLMTITRNKIPYKKIISLSISIITLLSFIITHFILCNNPYTYKYKEVDGGVEIIGYSSNITNYYKKLYIEIPSHIKGKEVKVIGQNAFANSQDFSILNLPTTVEVVEYNAFGHSNVTEINLPNGLKSIKEQAFVGTNVYYVNIPSSVSYVGERAFNPKTILIAKDKNIEEFWFNTNIVYYNSIGVKVIDNITYVLHEDNTASVAKINTTGKVKILDRFMFDYEEYIVTTIGYKSGYNESFEEIIIPNTIIKIEKLAFSINKNLTKVHIPSSVIVVEEDIFSHSPNVKISVEFSERPEEWSINWNSENKHVSWGVNDDELFTFTADNSGTYIITTDNSSSYIPNIEIVDYNFDYNTTIMDERNVLVEAYFKKGSTYKIKVTYDEINLSSEVDLSYQYMPQELKLGDNSIDLSYEEYYYKFVPKYDSYYKFTDSNNETLMVYDENLNPQSGYDNYSILYKDKIYYIVIKNEDYSIDKLNINVKDRIKIMFYNNISSAYPLVTMWYSFLSKDELYIPNMNGYKFIGWETSDKTKIIDLEEYILTNNLMIYNNEPILKLYAIWEVNK